MASPIEHGQALAEFAAELTPRLFGELEQARVVATDRDPRAQAAREWECFALYACVRGLVAAGGFNRETASAIDAMHERVLERWTASSDSTEPFEVRRARLAERYAEYGTIGQEGGAGGAATVTERLGEAAARHMTAPATPGEGLAEMVGSLHEALAEGAAALLRERALPPR